MKWQHMNSAQKSIQHMIEKSSEASSVMMLAPVSIFLVAALRACMLGAAKSLGFALPFKAAVVCEHSKSVLLIAIPPWAILQ